MTLIHVLVAIYRIIICLWNACIVLLQVVQSVIQEAKQEAAELMALLDDGAPMKVSPHQWSGYAHECRPDWLLLTGRAHVHVVATRCRWSHKPMANADYCESVLVRAPPPAIQESRAPFGSG